jgi:hypothetical protein
VTGISEKIHPKLFPELTFPLDVNAVHVAPPVPIESIMEQLVTVFEPELSDSVKRVPGVALFNVTRLPDVPEAVKDDTVCVVPAVKVIVTGCVVLVMLTNVLLPVIVNAPAPSWLRVAA